MSTSSSTAPLHPQEAQRLLDLMGYGAFGTPSEDSYDDLVHMAADVCGTQIALLSLVGENQLHFKSRCGFSLEYADRDGSFCSHAVLHEDMLIIEDATTDVRFKEHPLVMCPDMHVRFYAGVPLLSSNKLPMGVLCVIGNTAQSLSDRQKRSLRTIASQITANMELKKALGQMHEYAEQLKTLNANKDRFFSIMAHDLKGAFHGLIGFAEVLDEEFETLDASSMHRIAKFLHESSRETFGMLENLLEWSRLEDGSIAFKPENLDLSDLAKALKRRLGASAAAKKIEIVLKVDEGLKFFGDRHMLDSILHNLLSNALKFSRPNSEITVAILALDHHFKIQVSDQGVGMSQEQVRRLFTPGEFKSTRGTKGEAGSGLGLVLCREFADRHDGSISVQSEQSKGTTFEVILPRKKKKQARFK